MDVDARGIDRSPLISWPGSFRAVTDLTVFLQRLNDVSDIFRRNYLAGVKGCASLTKSEGFLYVTPSNSESFGRFFAYHF
jgi:hypothetical protein